MQVITAPSFVDPNTFFIFRENGVEVRVKIASRNLFPSHPLSHDEREYFDKNIISKFPIK